MLVVTISGPLLVAALVVGLLVAIFQAATQINEATLVFIPKLAGIGAILMFFGMPLYRSLVDFTHFLIDRMVAVGGS